MQEKPEASIGQAFRQALAERHGTFLQEQFSRASVAICGLGGLGSNIAILLARAGIGRLHLLDFDQVDMSNLNRQQYFISQIGTEKTVALAETLRNIAPCCEIVTDTVKLTEENIPSLLRQDTYICEAFDNPQEKAMLVNTVLTAFPEKYLIAASGMAGIGTANAIRTRRITERFYLCGDEKSELIAGEGLFAARVALCAAHQAQQVLRLIAGKADV